MLDIDQSIDADVRGIADTGGADLAGGETHVHHDAGENFGYVIVQPILASAAVIIIVSGTASYVVLVGSAQNRIIAGATVYVIDAVNSAVAGVDGPHLIGVPNSRATENAIPPLAVPSSFAIMMSVMSTDLANS